MKDISKYINLDKIKIKIKIKSAKFKNKELLIM
jgi:hypothetical protein